MTEISEVLYTRSQRRSAPCRVSHSWVAVCSARAMATTRYLSFPLTPALAAGVQTFICAEIYLLLVGARETDCKYAGEKVMFVHARLCI